MKILLVLFSLGLSVCGSVTTEHYETSLYYGGRIQGAQAMNCDEVLGLLRCDVYHRWGNPIEMWCDADTCVYETELVNAQVSQTTSSGSADPLVGE